MEAKDLVCLRCKHYRPLAGGCEAFGLDIPKKIIWEGDPHTKPLPEQENDIVFEPIKKQKEND